ncbi:MAG: HAMP domain-containing histidine kinase [Methylococcaceae bacterium]|nr:HAMP domain-containing histidine kinase [Methylococcaceae bacterium]
MDKTPADIIYPCPFSKGYGIPVRQAWLLLRVYLSYRLILASLFLGVMYSQWGGSLISVSNRPLFFYTSHGYLAVSLLSAVCVAWRWTAYSVQAQLLLFSDIFLLTLIMHASGGVNSGMGALLGVAIASGGLLIGGRCAMSFAALASLMVLAEQVVNGIKGGASPSSYTYAGMLGASFFTIALLSHILAKRSEQTLQLADQQKHTIIKLEELNRYIIQHLQSGIIITNKSQQVQMANDAALRLLAWSVMPINLSVVSAQLALAFAAWIGDPARDSLILQRPDQADIHCRFIPLPTGQAFFYMVVFEDIALYHQRVQQSKLASLGRLTASIAHEIRNPLGAISHAGQLLSESPDLPVEDQRLTRIIETNSKRVNHIIEDILQLSKRTDSRREKIYLKPWLAHYMRNFLMANGLGLAAFDLLQRDDTLCVLIDPNHLKQILDNLCQNALRYGKPELGAITLQVRYVRNMPCIDVLDNGPGLATEQIKHLFEPFFTTSSSGAGLGLYISKELAELNQAKLSYHLSNENRSCFRLCLPDANQTVIEI